MAKTARLWIARDEIPQNEQRVHLFLQNRKPISQQVAPCRGIYFSVVRNNQIGLIDLKDCRRLVGFIPQRGAVFEISVKAKQEQ